MIEEWRDIVGWEGFYQVSDQGRVRSLDRVVLRSDGKTQTIRSRIKATKRNQDGYVVVELFQHSCSTYLKMHRLVAEAFIPNPENLPQVDHRYGDKEDNRAQSLRWASLSLNNRNRHKTSATSGVVGVTFRPDFKSKYHAHMKSEDGRQLHLGSFATLAEAAACRANHERKYR